MNEEISAVEVTKFIKENLTMLVNHDFINDDQIDGWIDKLLINKIDIGKILEFKKKENDEKTYKFKLKVIKNLLERDEIHLNKIALKYLKILDPDEYKLEIKALENKINK